MPKNVGIQLNDTINSSGSLCDLKINVVRDSENKIVSGLCIGDVTQQNKALILIIEPGESKEFPTLGVGLSQAILDDDFLEIRHNIRRNFARDGLKITKLDLFNAGQSQIEANY